MCAVTSIVDCSVRSIESIDGRYGGCWRRSSPKPPSHKPRRRLNSSSTPGPVDCARAVWRKRYPGWVPFGAAPPQVTPPPPPPDNPLQTAPSLFARYDDARESPLARARCGGGGARSLARSRARCVAVAMAFGYTARHARYARRASRALTRTSSPRIARVVTVFRSPSTHACARCALRRRSLARSLARVRVWRWRWRWRWRSVTSRVTRVTRARVHVIAAHRARHHRPPSPDVTHTRARQRRRRCLVCSLARARGGGGGGVGGGGRLLRASRVSNTSRAPLVTRAHAHIITASRASSPFSVPPAHDRHARAAAAAALARSLARVRCGVGGGGGVQLHRASCARVTHVTRARVYVIAAHRARHHRPPSPMSPMRARGSGGGAVSFARSLARAEAEAVGLGEAVGYIARHACQTRHARRSSRARTRISSPLRARHHRFPSPPRTTGTRALLRRRCSLARSRACGVALALAVEVAFSYTAHHARHARARVRHHRASRASSPPPFPDVTHARARQRWRRCLVCSLPRARGGGGGRSFARRACLARHARARARHHRHGTC